MQNRICTSCRQEKPLEEFHKCRHGKYGRRAACAVCCNKKWSTPERRIRRDIQRKEARQNPEYRAIECERQKRHNRANPLAYMLKSAKSRALRKGLEFSITVNDLHLPEVCPLLEIPLKVNINRKEYNSYSLDRRDNSLGYIPGNVWVISEKANRIKNDASIRELKILIKNLEKIWEH